MKKIILISLFLLTRITFASTEDLVASFQSGSNIGSNQALTIGTALTVQDSWFNYMLLNPSTYTNVFKIKENWATVRLRYDDSKKFDYGSGWKLSVTYNVELYDASNNLTSITNEVLGIKYMSHASPSDYTDIALKKYPNAYKIKVTIVNVQFTPGGPSIPLSIEDVYLDVVEHTERYFVLNTSTPVNVGVQAGFNPFATFGNTKVQLPVTWSHIDGAESYDVEWLFIDVGNNNYTANYAFDFRNASRVNVSDNHYDIQLAYPAGIILYRIRPIGFNYDGVNLTRVEGAWSFISSGTTGINAPSVNASYRYNFSGLNKDKNWEYTVSYTEDGKREEEIHYFDGSERLRQSVSINYAEDNAIVSEPIIDYEGRNVGSFLPVPVDNGGIRFYNSTGFYGFNQDYGPNDFDRDVNVNNPVALSVSVGASKYYGALNGYPGALYTKYIPDAQGFPYVRTTYMTDGTNRVRKQAGAGQSLKMGSGKEVYYIYGKPSSQTELDRLFGNETGPLKHYAKNIVKDENGQYSVSYLDKEGRTVATALTGAAPVNLITLDNKPANVPVSDNVLANNNEISVSNELVSSQLITVGSPSQYDFNYVINPSQFCRNCDDNYQFCRDCKYDVEISIRDEDGILLSNLNIITSSPVVATNANPILFSGVAQGNVSFSVFLPPGVYMLNKVLKVNQAALDAAVQEFIDEQKLDPKCLDVKKIVPESCENDCHAPCVERYTYYNSETGLMEYYDDDGNPITQAAADILIADCEAFCNNPVFPVEPGGYCGLKLQALKRDFSPGGQYFSNSVVQFTNDPVQGIIESPTYAAHKYDYLTTNLSTQSSGLFSTFSTISGVTISSWQDVETNWQDVFADHLVVYHPEYCAYKYFCEGTIRCEGTPSSTIDILSSNAFDNLLNGSDDVTAGANGYFNLVNKVFATAHSVSDFTNGNTAYCPFNAATGNNQDPFVKQCNVKLKRCSSSTESYLNNYFSRFMPLGNGNHFSIWYVMDDPDNIHLIPSAGPGTPPQGVIDAFKQLHGDGTALNPGFFASVSKWQFIKSTYLFLKQLFIYDAYANYACPPPSVKGQFATAPTTVSLVHDQFTIHFPKNPIFEQFINATGSTCNFLADAPGLASIMSTNISNSINSSCQTSCSQSADMWMNQLSGCNLTATQLSNIRYYLIEVCKKECSPVNYMGTNGCTLPAPGCTAVSGPSSTLFYNFSDVINYFTGNTCQVNIVHPPAINDANCACTNLSNYISENGLSSASDAVIATSVNAALGYQTSYTATDIANWKSICNGAGASVASLTAAGYPSAFLCNTSPSVYNAITHSCNKISSFINLIGYDATNPAHYPYIVSAINNFFTITPGQELTVAQLTSILSGCQSANITSMTVFQTNNIPAVLLSPEPLNADPLSIQEAEEMANCMQKKLEEATAKAKDKLSDSQEKELKDKFIKDYTAHCLGIAKSTNEQLVMSYVLDEFKYTLYYYDQAGNIVKTVPPEGVDVITNPVDLQKVKDYRNGTIQTPFYPAHRMITRSTYDSYENNLETETPDGGLVMYWINRKNQIVNSQTSVQRQQSPKHYSYFIYDLIGRLKEAGDMENSLQITTEIARGNDQAVSYSSWFSSSPVSTWNQIRRLYYDRVTLPVNIGTPGQSHLRNRVAHASFQRQNVPAIDYITHYSYDVHGNTVAYAQENKYTDAGGNPIVPVSEQVKTTRVEYELLSGNIKAVNYQSGAADQYFQAYTYDANNRLAKISSSLNKMIWETDAMYFYYKHLPLARMEYGDKQVQGMDFAYTLQGWLKGINSSYPSIGNDIGKDGLSSGINSFFGMDGYALTNGYYKGDYSAINSFINTPSGNFIADPFAQSNAFGDYLFTQTPTLRNFGLYDGTITHATYGIQKPDGGYMQTLGRTYLYDQDYRLKEQRSFADFNLGSNNAWAASAQMMNYSEDFGYDMNSNLQVVTRNGYDINGVALPMDFCSYQYYKDLSQKLITNQLHGIDDVIAPSNFSEDIDDQQAAFSALPPNNDPGLNYGYNSNGQLVKDLSEGIDNVTYTEFGNIAAITRHPSFYKLQSSSYVYLSDIEFRYDAYGRRVMKIEKPRIGGAGGLPPSTVVSPNQWKYTIYSYGKDNNMAAIYTRQWNGSGTEFRLKEQYISGSDRLAQINNDLLLPAPAPSVSEAGRMLGNKVYEVQGNTDAVYSTISDIKVSAFTSANTVSYYKPVVLESKDYYAFGMPITNRNYISSSYRYGFNGGSEKDQEVTGQENTYGTYYRELDTRTAKWWSVDPVVNASESPYAMNGNNPVNMNDPMGDLPDKAKGGALRTAGEWISDNFSYEAKFRFSNSEKGGWSHSVNAEERYNGNGWISKYIKVDDGKKQFAFKQELGYRGGQIGGNPTYEQQMDFKFSTELKLNVGKIVEDVGGKIIDVRNEKINNINRLIGSALHVRNYQLFRLIDKSVVTNPGKITKSLINELSKINIAKPVTIKRKWFYED